MTYTLYFVESGSQYLIGSDGKIRAKLSHKGKFYDLKKLQIDLPVVYIKEELYGVQKIENPHNLPEESQIFIGDLEINIKLFKALNMFLSNKNGRLEDFLKDSIEFTSPIQSKKSLTEEEAKNYINAYNH